MNEIPDPLEAELSALSPHDVSPNLRRRIAERLIVPPRPKLSRLRLRWLALTGGLAAACLVAVVYWWSTRGVDSPSVIVVLPDAPSVEPGPRVVPVTPAGTADWEPRLLAYRRALARSTEELDVLLTREARVASEPLDQTAQFRAFTPSNASLNAFLGDN
jgi:hypothetical protein